MRKRVLKLPVRLPNGALKWPHALYTRYCMEVESDPRQHLLALGDPCDNLTHSINSQQGPHSASRTTPEDPR